MNQPLKLWPDLAYAVLCGFPPQKLRNTVSLLGVANEIVAPRLPYHKDLYLVVAWDGGLGSFALDLEGRDEDGKPVFRTAPFDVAMYLEGRTQQTMPLQFDFSAYGLITIEGFLDGESSFKTRLRVVPT